MPEVVSVVACGPSALKCGAERAPGFVIAVNDAYQHVRHDAVVSMDGRWAGYRVPDMPDGEQPWYIRRSAWSHVCGASFSDKQPTLEQRGRVRLFDNDRHSAFAESRTRETPPWGFVVLNGPNSGYCALNLAYLMRPRVVYLFGFDHHGGHFHPENEWRARGEGCANTPRKFTEWAAACHNARSQFDMVGTRVINTNPNSLITAFKFGSAPQ